jgi:hypothetical protein
MSQQNGHGRTRAYQVEIKDLSDKNSALQKQVSELQTSLEKSGSDNLALKARIRELEIVRPASRTQDVAPLSPAQYMPEIQDEPLWDGIPAGLEIDVRSKATPRKDHDGLFVQDSETETEDDKDDNGDDTAHKSTHINRFNRNAEPHDLALASSRSSVASTIAASSLAKTSAAT